MSSAHRPAIPFPNLNSRGRRAATTNAAESSRGWKLPSPGRRLLDQLAELSLLVVEGAQTLRETGLNGERVGRIQALAQRAADVDLILFGKLSRSLVTPLDAEDMQHVAARLRRVIEEQVRMARLFDWAEQSSVEIPVSDLTECSLRCAAELSAAARSLPGGEAVVIHSRNIHKERRSAKLLMRDWRSRVIASGSITRILRFEQFAKPLTAIFAEYILAARALEHVLFKNG